MDNSTTLTPGVSPGKSKRGGWGCVFLFCLFFLIIGVIPPLHDLPGLLARFSGIETTAHVTRDGSCSYEEANNTGGETVFNGYYYVYTFTASSGKVYQIGDPSCNTDTIGANETVWYQPADPTQFITVNAWTFDWLFFSGFSIPILLFVYGYFRWLFKRSRWIANVQGQ